jgi:hypothetical protein
VTKRLLDAQATNFTNENDAYIRRYLVLLGGALGALGEIKLQQRNYSESEKLLREALQTRQQKGPDSWELLYYTESMLGASLWGSTPRLVRC